MWSFDLPRMLERYSQGMVTLPSSNLHSSSKSKPNLNHSPTSNRSSIPTLNPNLNLSATSVLIP